jgi:hypothetical protein
MQQYGRNPFFINTKQMGNISLVIVKQKHMSAKLIFPFRGKGKLPCASPESLLSSGFLTAAIDGDGWSGSLPGRFPKLQQLPVPDE